MEFDLGKYDDGFYRITDIHRKKFYTLKEVKKYINDNKVTAGSADFYTLMYDFKGDLEKMCAFYEVPYKFSVK